MMHRSQEPKFRASAIHLIHRAQQCADRLLETRMQQLGLTSTQLIVLSAVSAQAGMSQAQLCAVTGVDRTTMAQVVQRMVKKDLLQRKHARTDGRTYRIELAPRGCDVMIEAAAASEMASDKLLAALPAERRERFIENLRGIVGDFGPASGRSQQGNLDEMVGPST